MANFNSSNSSSTSTYGSCQARVTHMEELFYLCCLGPAILIVLVLAFLNKRISYKKQACNGQPGLVVPFDFFSGHKNRITIAMAFGATAGNVLIILFSTSTLDYLPGPPWVRVFQGLVIVVHFGIINYPFFACLTTDHRLVGSSFGFIYSTTRFVVSMVVSFKCKYYFDENITLGAYLSFYSLLPTLLCQLFLVIRFFVLLIWSLRRIMKMHNVDQPSLAELCLAPLANFNHVRTLFSPMAARFAELQKPWYVRFRDSIYKPKPEFKFSTQMLSTVIVGAIILYALLLQSSVIGSEFVNLLGKLCQYFGNSSSTFGPNSEIAACSEVINVTNYCLIAAIVLSAVLSVVHLVHLLACHRRHVYLLYHTRKLFFKGSVYSPARLVGRSLSYSGYQIAYIALGFIIAAVSLFFVIWPISFLVMLKDNTELKNILYTSFMGLLPVVGFATCVWIFQYVLSNFVFRDRSFPDITVAVDNRQVFCIMSYFFFFFNVVVGMIACFMRIMKGALLGVVFLARIDRTSMIEGFYSWDPGYIAYLGHVYFYVAHHHPVLLVFCQLLVNSKRNQSDEFVESYNTEGSVGSREESRRRYQRTADVIYGTIQRPNIGSGTQLRDGASYTGESTSLHKRVRMSQRGYNRWFLAWTLMKNPGLISQRSKGRSASRAVYLVNSGDYADNQLLVP